MRSDPNRRGFARGRLHSAKSPDNAFPQNGRRAPWGGFIGAYAPAGIGVPGGSRRDFDDEPPSMPSGSFSNPRSAETGLLGVPVEDLHPAAGHGGEGRSRGLGGEMSGVTRGGGGG